MKTLEDLGIKTDRLLDVGVVERIAKAYKASVEQVFQIPNQDVIKFKRVIAFQFAELSKKIDFVFVPYEKYKYERAFELLPEYEHGRIIVNSTGNNSTLWGECHNLMFRAVHDYFHAEFQLDFNYLDEIVAYEKQVKHSMFMVRRYDISPEIDWQLYARILRSEIVYQAAYKTFFKEFHLPEQKIILEDL